MTGLALEILLLLLLIAPAVSAQETLRLTMADAVSRAVEHSEDAAISSERRKRTRDSYVRVRSAVFPQVWGDFGWRRYADLPEQTVDFGGGPQKLSFMQPWEMEANLNLSQVLWSFGRVGSAIEAARRGMDATRLSEESVKLDAAFAAKKAYLTLLLARDAARIAEESYQNALENQKTLRSRFGGGRISRIDNVKMAADVESRLPQMLGAKARERSLTIAFKRMIGAPPDAEVELLDAMDDDFPELRARDLREKMLAGEPSLLAAREQVRFSEAVRGVKRGGFFPTVSALANYRYYGNARDPYPGSDYMDPSLMVGLKVSVPIYGGGLKEGELHEAERDREMAELSRKKLRRDLEVRLATALAEYESSLGVFEAAEKARRLAEESYLISQSSFKAGKASQTQLNDAELQLTAAKLGVDQARYELHLLLARIERLAGAEGKR